MLHYPWDHTYVFIMGFFMRKEMVWYKCFYSCTYPMYFLLLIAYPHNIKSYMYATPIHMYILFDSQSFNLPAASAWPQLLNPYLMEKYHNNSNYISDQLDIIPNIAIKWLSKWFSIASLWIYNVYRFYGLYIAWVAIYLAI